MFLAIDVGNTHVDFGVLVDDMPERDVRVRVLHRMRFNSRVSRTVDEYGMLLAAGLQNRGVACDEITRIVICSVVPPLTDIFREVASSYFKQQAEVITCGWFAGLMDINLDNPTQIGVDRLVNGYYARSLYGSPVIVVDIGTATTFDVVGVDGAFDGGVIAPGLGLSQDALVAKTALLPPVELKAPEQVIGRNTKEAMLSGLVWGYVGLVEGLLGKIMGEIGQQVKVVATGGLGWIVVDNSRMVLDYDRDFTLQGIYKISHVAKEL